MALFDHGGRFTEVLRVSDSFSRNFFLYLLIRDFSRKRTSKEQYPSVIVFFSFLAMAFYEGGYRGKQAALGFFAPLEYFRVSFSYIFSYATSLKKNR